MKFALVVATAAALALVVADGASAGSRVAYFKVSLAASQDVSWEQHTTSPTCDGGSADIEGIGTSALRLRTPRPQPAVARRVRGALGAALTFGKRDAGLPVVGTITRKGVNYATRVTPGKLPPCQATSNPTAPDCGTKRYPAGRALWVRYYTPESWPYDSGPTPLINSMALHGPSARGFQPPIFRRCPGVNGDDLLRGPAYGNEAVHSGPGGLPPAKLFGALRRFEVTGISRDRVETVPRTGPVTGTWPVTTKTRWTLTFTRLASRPKGL